MIERLTPPGLPAPRGPYSPAVRAGEFIFLVRPGPRRSANQISPGDIRHETRLTLSNMKRLLEGVGASLADVVKVGVYLADAADFAGMNEVYTEFFGESKPARTTIVCKFMSKIRIEVDCIAYKPAPGRSPTQAEISFSSARSSPGPSPRSQAAHCRRARGSLPRARWIVVAARRRIRYPRHPATSIRRSEIRPSRGRPG